MIAQSLDVFSKCVCVNGHYSTNICRMSHGANVSTFLCFYPVTNLALCTTGIPFILLSLLKT